MLRNFVKIVLFAAIAFFAEQCAFSSDNSSRVASIQDKRTFTCEVCRTDEGWKIIPNTSFLTPSYWKNVCHSDRTFASKEEAIHILEVAGWTMMPMTDGDCIKFQKSAEWSASPDAIDRWNEFWKNNPYAKEE